jgi:hypothetical protein
MAPKKQVYQFKITLKDSKPPIWRRIQVPSTYTFYDLHVAIQDAMGWYDSHLHEFRINTTTGEPLVLGTPPNEMDDFGDEESFSDSKFKISKYESILPKSFTYTYDFGDNWEHKIDFEKVLTVEVGVTYPICVKGKRACPPEDCGGIWGYEELLETLADPEHEEYEEMTDWVESMTGGPFDPEEFDPAEIVFSNPKERLAQRLS